MKAWLFWAALIACPVMTIGCGGVEEVEEAPEQQQQREEGHAQYQQDTEEQMKGKRR